MQAAFDIVKTLGKGAYGTATLVKTKAPPHDEYVVKTMEFGAMSKKDRLKALQEAQVCWRCRLVAVLLQVSNFSTLPLFASVLERVGPSKHYQIPNQLH